VKPSEPTISVVIPTFNRQPILARALAALARQDLAPERFEVLVVDDGSSDDTWGWLQGRDFAFHCRPLRQENQGQGNARNFGVREATGELILFLGDDIFLDPNALSRHAARHDEVRSAGVRAAVLGHIRWAAELRVSSFMRWIGERGLQFGFALIEDPSNVPFNFFYTSNISVARRELLAAGLFDPRFKTYGWEDIELGYRLARRGVKIVYEPEADAAHYHPTNLKSFARRQYRAGVTGALFYRLHPELGEFLQVPRASQPPEPGWRRALRRLLCRMMEPLPEAPWPELYDRAMWDCYLEGLRKGLAESG